MYNKHGIFPGRPLKSWQGYIKLDSQLISKINNLLPKDKFAELGVDLFMSKNNSPPVFVYLEIPDETGYNIETFYSNPESSRAIRGFAINRELLGTELRSVDGSSRGTILSAFCEIEFLIDVMICLTFGVYEGKTSYKNIKSLYKHDCDRPDNLEDTETRIQHLLKNKKISTDTYKYLKMAKKVRNTLAHQYMPSSSVGLTKSEISPYTNIGEAVYAIFNTAWFLLLKDYVPQQEVVVDWLSKQKNHK